MIINNQKPTCYYCNESPVVVYTLDGKPFYAYKNATGARVHFNLPKGMFETANLLDRAQLRKYKVEKPPKHERNIKMPKHIHYEFGNNKNKASIHLATGGVLLDKAFLEKPNSFIQQIKLHELAHYYYATEWKCDRWAQYVMVKLLGYNPSQVGSCNGHCLSEHSQERIDIAKAYAQKIK